jgi:hypothetical protein
MHSLEESWIPWEVLTSLCIDESTNVQVELDEECPTVSPKLVIQIEEFVVLGKKCGCLPVKEIVATIINIFYQRIYAPTIDNDRVLVSWIIRMGLPTLR